MQEPLVPLRRLLARFRIPAARAEAWRRLRARFTAQPGVLQWSREERALASRVRQLKRELADAYQGVVACTGCAHGAPLPAGRWEGGRCCGTQTELVFSLDEVRALSAAGTRLDRSRLPEDEVAGCIFRGARGCSLAAEDRPSVCLVYVCGDLQLELRGTERGERIRALRLALQEAFEAFLLASLDGGAK